MQKFILISTGGIQINNMYGEILNFVQYLNDLKEFSPIFSASCDYLMMNPRCFPFRNQINIISCFSFDCRRREQQVLESDTTRHTHCVAVAVDHRITFRSQRVHNAVIQPLRHVHVS